jgi:hypothetical protein
MGWSPPSRMGHTPLALVGRGMRPHAPGMFVVSEAEAAAIRAVFDQRGELSAAVGCRRNPRSRAVFGGDFAAAR